MCGTLILPHWLPVARYYRGSDLVHTGVGVDRDIGTGGPVTLWSVRAGVVSWNKGRD